MNKLSSYALLSIIALSQTTRATEQAATKTFILKDEALAFSDGKFITADTIELMRKFQRKIVDILLGEHVSESKRVGKYSLHNNHYGVHELALMEETIDQNSPTHEELRQCLKQAKEDFMAVTTEFKKFAQGANEKLIINMIEESCTLRNRKDSILIAWASKSEANERVILEKKVTTFKGFKQFLLDLYNFISDVITSCPKAQALENARMVKWNKIKELLPHVLADVPLTQRAAKQTAFLTHLKLNHLDTLNLSDITTSKLQGLLAHLH